MSENIKVSIIIPVHNVEKYIDDTINSVLNQSYKNWEMILVDDCSSDNSVKVIEKYLNDERIKLIKQDENVRAALTRNRGIEEATGDYIAFLDSDDIWIPEKLEKQLKFIKEYDCAFSFTAYEFGNEAAQPTGKIVHVPSKLTYKKALSRTVIFTSTVIFDLTKIDKEMIKMVNVPSEDTATWWKILRNGYVAYGLEEVLTIYRRPPKTLSSNKKVAIKRIWNLYRNVEKLNIFSSLYNFVFWAFRATFRRL